MRCSVNLLVVIVLLLATASATCVAQAQHQVPHNNQLTSKHDGAEFKNKLYRQALFFYFSGNYAQALRQISINNQRFNANTAKSDVFNAGLQVSMGLQQQASKSLLAIAAQQSQKPTTRKQKNDGSKSATSPDELLLIALLQLSGQQVEQGNNRQAQQTLAKIKQVSSAYYQQYYTLNQLAYWPAAPEHLAPISSTNKSAKSNPENNSAPLSSPYIQVNQALWLIENHDYQQAETLLLAVKNQQPKSAKITFWQQLFSPFAGQDENDIANTNSQNDSDNDTQIQQQAIADYAQLLLAQMYIKQQRYTDSFATLKSFPQHSSYSESALFLFAYAAQKTQHYELAITLFDLLQQQYPYSNLGWQSALLKASQMAEQHQQNTSVPDTLQDGSLQEKMTTAEREKLLSQSLLNYQQVADFFKHKLNDLTRFEQAFLTADNLLTFSAKVASSTSQEPAQQQLANKDIIDQLTAVTPYQTNSPWLQKALQNPALKGDYQYLTEFDILTRHLQQQQNKNQWLNYTLALNKSRQDNIFGAQQQQPISAVISKLKARRDQLAEMLNIAEQQQKLQLLANAKQQKWLQSITKGEEALTIIKTQRNITHYQKRLQRIKGVLQWQLSQQFIPRLWQHKTQLAVIDKQLALAQKQQQKFTRLANAHQSLSAMAQRQQKATVKLNALVKKIPQITAKANQQIKAQVQVFINQQRARLTANLLTAQHAIATILEKMSSGTQQVTTTKVPPLALPKQEILEQTKSEGL